MSSVQNRKKIGALSGKNREKTTERFFTLICPPVLQNGAGYAKMRSVRPAEERTYYHILPENHRYKEKTMQYDRYVNRTYQKFDRMIEAYAGHIFKKLTKIDELSA